MTLWSDLLPQTTLASASATIKGLWASSGVPLTNVRRTAVQFQAAMAHVNAAYSFTQIVNKLVRGFGSLDTATDPGDNDPYDPNNVTLAQSPGLLSYLGQNTYGTTRTQATNAATTVTLMNSSASVATITADALTFTCGATGTTAYGATYRNSYSSSIYASAGNTTTILPGGTLTIPVTAEIAGSAPSAPANSLTLTSTVLGLSVLAQPAAIGLDVEPAADYRSRCRGAAAMLSMCGPGQAYSFIATAAQVDSSGNVWFYPINETEVAFGISATDAANTTTGHVGTPVIFTAPVGSSLGVTRVAAMLNPTQGYVNVYFAGPSAPTSSTVVNQLANLFNAVYWPDCTQRNFYAASTTSFPIGGTIYARPGPGVNAVSVAQAAYDALVAAWPLIPLGGFNQTVSPGTGADSGYLYVDTIDGFIRGNVGGISATDSAVLANVYKFVPSGMADIGVAAGSLVTLSASPASFSVVIQ